MQADISLKASGSARVLVSGRVVQALTVTGGRQGACRGRGDRRRGSLPCPCKRGVLAPRFSPSQQACMSACRPAGAPVTAPQTKTALVSFTAGDTPLVVEVRQRRSACQPAQPACLPAERQRLMPFLTPACRLYLPGSNTNTHSPAGVPPCHTCSLCTTPERARCACCGALGARRGGASCHWSSLRPAEQLLAHRQCATAS